MTYVGYLVAGWGAALVTLGAYSLRLIRRGRRLAALVPPSERRWTSE